LILISGGHALGVLGPWSADVAITRIPDIYRPGFIKMKALSPSEVESISEALSKSPLSGGLRGMIGTVGERVPSLTRKEVEDILRALYSLYLYRHDSEGTLPKFVSELIAAMGSSGKELTLTEDEKGKFQDTISKLLNVDALQIASKAEELRQDYACTFYDAKILTDVRPIFAKPEDRPIGVAITHTLKIVYHKGSAHKEFYVAMDAEDLEKMKRVVQRAETKASSLASLIKSANLSDLSEEKSQ
jgi:uncharacterized protein YfkK (UPF0435 family)